MSDSVRDALFVWLKKQNAPMFITHGGGASVTANEAANEARFAVLTERIDEAVRDHLDQTGLRPKAAEAQIQASGNMSGHVKFTHSKEMMPDSFKGTERMKFSDRNFKTSNLFSVGDYEHAGNMWDWVAQEQEDVAEDKFDKIAMQWRWTGQSRDHTRFPRYCSLC